MVAQTREFSKHLRLTQKATRLNFCFTMNCLQTSFTTLWTLYLIARNPDVQKQLHDEVSSVLKPGERATPAALQKMPFLRACIKETLR